MPLGHTRIVVVLKLFTANVVVTELFGLIVLLDVDFDEVIVMTFEVMVVD